jgi:hypothetical protein
MQVKAEDLEDLESTLAEGGYHVEDIGDGVLNVHLNGEYLYTLTVTRTEGY